MLNGEYTHRVAVAGLIVKDNKVLMLRRTHPPYIWAPPGGHLYTGEHPLTGLKREVMEECSLVVEPVRPVSVYMGEHRGQPLLGISFACRYVRGDLRLCDEHSDSVWLDPNALAGQDRPGAFAIAGLPALGVVEDYAAAVEAVKEVARI